MCEVCHEATTADARESCKDSYKQRYETLKKQGPCVTCMLLRMVMSTVENVQMIRTGRARTTGNQVT
jgi:hypothetical protein